jgi:EAL domain-containing protein (putative c-di-GMP-specific phosphodiesterase class I)
MAQDGGIAGQKSSPLDMAISQSDRETLTLVREAIVARRVRLAWQPVVMAADPGKIAFHEGLVRVLDPTGRVIPARDFMAVVETRELGREIDCLALEAGLSVLARHPGQRIAINMSARSIGYPRWLRVLKRGLQAGPDVGARLILEINEDSVMQVPEVVGAFMTEMQPTGVAFALDDFGAGFTALRQFKEFFFDILKIDGQYVRGLEGDADNRALVSTMVTLARHFDMFTVAETVETPAEAELLRGLGVDCLQGYLFGAPSMRPDWAEAAARRSA